MFHYQTGEEVCLGDEIKYSDWHGIVEFFIEPETKLAKDYSAPMGGCMLLFFTGGRVLLDAPEEEEDFVLLHRFNDSISAEFERQGQLCKSYADGAPLLIGDKIEYSVGGCTYGARVIAVYPPFEQSAWKMHMPTGGFQLEFADGTKVNLGEVPSSMRLLARNGTMGK